MTLAVCSPSFCDLRNTKVAAANSVSSGLATLAASDANVLLSDIAACEFGAQARSGSDIIVTFADAAAEATYRLERKRALSDATWESPLAGASDFTASQNGAGQLTHCAGAAEPKAFYRVRLLP